MIISSLEEMEQIVHSRADLEWDGWDVVRYSNSSNAIYSKDGAFKDGKWVRKTVYPLTSDGWYIPNSLRRATNAQVEG